VASLDRLFRPRRQFFRPTIQVSGLFHQFRAQGDQFGIGDDVALLAVASDLLGAIGGIAQADGLAAHVVCAAMHVFRATAHLFTRLDARPSRDDAGLIALPTGDSRLDARLFSLLASDRDLGADLNRLTTGLLALLAGDRGVGACPGA